MGYTSNRSASGGVGPVFPNYELITADTTWNNTNNLTEAWLSIAGAGAGAGKGDNEAGGHGGASGQLFERVKIDLTGVSSVVCTIGLGGRSYYRDLGDGRGNFTGDDGENGGTTSFGAILTALGGSGGQEHSFSSQSSNYLVGSNFGGMAGIAETTNNIAYAGMVGQGLGGGMPLQNLQSGSSNVYAQGGGGGGGLLLYWDEAFADDDSYIRSGKGWGAGGCGNNSATLSANSNNNGGCGVQGAIILEWV